MFRKTPDSGRFDQEESAVTWNSTIDPAPMGAAVTRGVPSSSMAQVRSGRSDVGSASTCRVTVTSCGTRKPAKGDPSGKSARCCGCFQLSEPPRDRSPARKRTGMRSSLPPAVRGPAKRTSVPPFSIQSRSVSVVDSGKRPTSARTSTEMPCSISEGTASAISRIARAAYIREGRKGALQIIKGRQQRLIQIARLA